MAYLFRMTKFHKPCLVSPKKYPLSQAFMKYLQTLAYLTLTQIGIGICTLFGLCFILIRQIKKAYPRISLLIFYSA